MDPYEQFLNAQAADPLMGSQPTGNKQEMDTNPMLIGGLGLGGGFVASQTGGAPATSQVLSSFAQKVAAQDAATRAAQRAAFNPAIIGQNLPAGGVNPAVTGTPKGSFQTPSSVFGSNLPAGGVNPEVKGRVKPNVFSSQKAKSLTPKKITPNNILGGSNAGLLSRLAGSFLTAATMPTPMGDSSLRGAYNSLVEAGEDPAAAAARLGVEDTSIRELDPSNREVEFMSDGTGVLNGVSLFTGGAKTTGNNYADVVNADNARREDSAAGNVYPPAEQPQDIQPVTTVVPTEQAGSDNLGLFSTGGYFNSPTGRTSQVSQPSQVAQPTQLDIFNSRVAAGEDANQVRIDLGVDANFGREPFIPGPTVEDVILQTQARGPDATYTPEELSQITSIQGADQANSAQFVQNYQDRQMDIAKSLQALGNVDDLRGVEAELAARGINRDLTTPFQQTAESLGEANASSSFTPRSTFISNGKYIQEDEFGQRRELTPEQYNAFQSNMAELGQPTQTPRPMGRDETRARLGGRTLSEYLNAPNGTEGVSGLRTDAQGRMIPGGSQTREQAYSGYEKAAAERDQRAAYDWANRGSQRGGSGGGAPQEGSEFFDPVASQNVPRDVREALNTPAQQRSADQRQRLSQWEVSTQGKKMGGISGYEESNKSTQQKQEDELRNRYMQARLAEFQKVEPSAYETAQSTVDDFIANGGGDKSKRSQYIAQILGLAPKDKGKGTGFNNFISGDIDSDLPTVLTDADFAELESGDRYIDSQGNKATKP